MKENVRRADVDAFEKSKEKYADHLEAVVQMCVDASLNGKDSIYIKYASLTDSKLKDAFEDAQFKRTLKRVAFLSDWECLFTVAGECRLLWVPVAGPGVQTTDEILSDIRDHLAEVAIALSQIGAAAASKT